MYTVNGTIQFSVLVLCLAAIPTISAAPAITGVMNAASNTPSVLPNGGIAPGSIFVVKGSGMGPAKISIAAAPFQATILSGTSAAVTVGGATVDALMYYTSDAQIAALLPSNTPTGAATITVTYNGQTSAPARFGVVSNNLGIFTVDSSGQGSGIVTFPDYSLVSPTKAANCGGPNTTCGAANPGDTLILWGTGLGRITGDDASGAGLGQNMPNLPLRLWIGGVRANVIYQGRSGCCVGEDQIIFTVPNAAPTGCAVPVVVDISPNVTEVSNSVLMPIANGSRDCTPADSAFQSIGIPKIQQALAAGSFSLGVIEMDHFLNDNGPGFHDQGKISFVKVTNSPLATPFGLASIDQRPLGTCVAQPGLGGGPNLGDLSPLDAGSKFSIQGPAGTQSITSNTEGSVTLSANGSFLMPGDYTITGTGGKDVGPFTAALNIPAVPVLTSPSGPNGLTVSRTKGMTVTWNPNGSTGHVELVIGSSADANNSASVVCTVAASAGTFTIPPYMLSALPAGNGTIFFFQPGDQGPASSSIFTASGLDIGLAQSFVDSIAFGGFPIGN